MYAGRGIYRLARFGLLLALVLVTAFAAWYYEPDPGGDAPQVLVSVDQTLWNRLRLNSWTYVRALRKAGMRPVLMDFESLSGGATASDLLAGMQGLLLSGGGDVGALRYGGDESVSRDVNPARDEFEIALLELAEKRGIPVLGLCRGAQLINVHRGGTLGDFREDSARYERHHRIWGGHPVSLEYGSRLAAIYSSTEIDSVVTYHGQYVDEPGNGLRIVAYAPDGTPEAIEVTAASATFMVGVQWHAEVWPWDSEQQALFDAFYESVSHHASDSD